MSPLTDITLTLPCPLCPSPGRMLTAIYEPVDTGDLPLLAEVKGCEHADGVLQAEGELDNQFSEEYFLLWDALHHAIEMDTLDRNMDRLEREED